MGRRALTRQQTEQPVTSNGVRRSLQRRIVASVMLGLGIVLVGLGYLVTLAFNYSREAALHERLAVAQAKQHELYQEIQDALDLLNRMRPDVVPGLRTGDRAVAYSALEHVLVEAGIFSGVALLLPDGKVTAAAGDSSWRQWLRSPPSLFALAANGEAAVFEVGAQPPSVGLASPVVSAGRTIGWIVTELQPSRLKRHLTPDHLGSGAYGAEVLTGDGRVVVASPDQVRTSSGHAALVAELARQRQAGVVLHSPSRGRPHYVAYVPLAIPSGWGVLIEQPQDVVVAIPLHLRRWMIGIGAAVLLAGTLVAWLDVRRVTTPLKALTDAAERIGRGDLVTSVNVVGEDEVGVLGRTIEAMRVRLGHSLDEVQEGERQAQALLAVSTQILAARDRDQVLEEIASRATTLLGREVALICLRGNGDASLRVVAAAGPQQAYDTTGAFPKSDDPAGPSQLLAEGFGPGLLAAPLRVGQETVGWLCLGDRRALSSSSNDTILMSGLANLASLAVENARLQAEAQSAATLRERERIARELHDGLAQALGAVYSMAGTGKLRLAKGNADGAEQALSEIGNLSRQAYEEVRQSIFGLRTMVARGLGLVPAITEYLHEFSERSGVPVRLIIEDEAATRLTPEVETQLIRIVQEALNNVWRHARARQAAVRFGFDTGMVRVVVEDDGIGFTPIVPPPGGRHYGLETMRERAESVGGVLRIESAPGQGTRVEVRLPVDQGR